LGDVAVCYADPSYAKELLGFETKFSLNDMCRDAVRWQMENVDGYPNE
jgi:UDP-glucose 4-epimerase